MIETIFGVLGGLGIFLIGMSIMTDGLKKLAGETLQHWLARFTRSPATGAATGAIGTAILQSSSATTVMAVGFAGASLLTFPQTLGIIFGANIGTTLTGWLVALLGFKLDLAKVVMPLIFIGAMFRLFGGRRTAAGGFAIAGFGLIFAGISTLQFAMEGLGDTITPDTFPADTTTGRLLLLAMGVVITLVTQSSSAGVATAITAVHVGTISLSQAGALVIGMDVGTTFTALLASAGGSVGAKRTGIAHVVYNLMTGVGAFLLLPWFVVGWDRFAAVSIRSDPEIALVLFHTLFNGLGVIAVLPFTKRFAGLIMSLVPTASGELTHRLETSLLTQSSVAITAVRATLVGITAIILRSLSVLLSTDEDDEQAFLAFDEAEQAILETRSYLSRIRIEPDAEELQRLYASSLHMVDHLTRLLRRARMRNRMLKSRSDETMKDLALRLATATGKPLIDEKSSIELNEDLAAIWNQIDRQMEPYRRRIIREAGHGSSETLQAIASLDAYRWLRRVAYHLWRIAYHLDPTTNATVEETIDAMTTEDDPDAISQDPH